MRICFDSPAVCIDSHTQLTQLYHGTAPVGVVKFVMLRRTIRLRIARHDKAKNQLNGGADTVDEPLRNSQET